MGAAQTEGGGNEPDYGVPDGIAAAHLDNGALGRNRGFLPLAVLGGLLAIALSGALGGAPNPTRAAPGEGAGLQVNAPETLRNGVFFEIDITADAERPIDEPVIAISRSYLHDITVNTHLPEPKDMGFEGNSFTMTFPPMKAGGRLSVKLDGQVNPPLVGRNSGAVTLRDGKRVLAQVPVSLKVLP